MPTPLHESLLVDSEAIATGAAEFRYRWITVKPIIMRKGEHWFDDLDACQSDVPKKLWPYEETRLEATVVYRPKDQLATAMEETGIP